jgi:hypothetical protein
MGIDLDVLGEFDSQKKESEDKEVSLTKTVQRRNSQPKQGKSNQEHSQDIKMETKK